ncbi:homeobox and leucine zipper encoding b [Cyprinodon tularosa]|uniref:homeobox and leucine zipper encoding b n=1 Tax=Cyprinodon tularosa TaxID=77115 RepID=UPI0018E1EB1A|nr:homeobox and leucine zipper encoding b [Cyprinodon tularosa]XP_038126299.1 homeobox and leucine zipper encoding b [Cyprinodon tularosa]
MMRHLADTTKRTPKQETPTAVEGNQAPSLPWSARLCLPVLCEDKRVIWVHANEVDMQPDEVEELNKAFSRSPYLTPKQTAALAQRCSLHPDQVRVWFMAQRLLCGISWDYEDIREVCNNLKSNNDDAEEDQELRDRFIDKEVKNKDQKSEGRECGGEVNWNGPRKQKRGRKRSKKQDDERITNGANMEPVLTKKRRAQTKLVSSGTGSQSDQQEEAMNPAPTSGTRQEETQAAKSQSNLKTDGQLLLLRNAFLQCQYPTAERYSSLTKLVGIQRQILVKWFVDARYYVKKYQPSWMTVKQHKEVVANIKNQQNKDF